MKKQKRTTATIYKITNGINGRIYVGRTIRTLEKRFGGHFGASCYSNSPIAAAIREYGVQNFSIKAIETVPMKVAPERELHWMAKLNSWYPSGYNVSGSSIAVSQRIISAEKIRRESAQSINQRLEIVDNMRKRHYAAVCQKRAAKNISRPAIIREA